MKGVRSLIQGVRELQEAWPNLDVGDGPIDDLVGFLFATLPLAEEDMVVVDKAAKILTEETSLS